MKNKLVEKTSNMETDVFERIAAAHTISSYYVIQSNVCYENAKILIFSSSVSNYTADKHTHTVLFMHTLNKWACGLWSERSSQSWRVYLLAEFFFPSFALAPI